MDAPNMHTRLDTLSAVRVAYTDLPAAQRAAILPQRDPGTAARGQGIITECDEREAHLQAEIAQQEAASTAAGLATGATAQGTSLQASIMAPRVPWDTTAMHVESTRHPEVLTSRKVGEPRVQMRARSAKANP
jgi:hypothetical protein